MCYYSYEYFAGCRHQRFVCQKLCDRVIVEGNGPQIAANADTDEGGRKAKINMGDGDANSWPTKLLPRGEHHEQKMAIPLDIKKDFGGGSQEPEKSGSLMSTTTHRTTNEQLYDLKNSKSKHHADDSTSTELLTSLIPHSLNLAPIITPHTPSTMIQSTPMTPSPTSVTNNIAWHTVAHPRSTSKPSLPLPSPSQPKGTYPPKTTNIQSPIASNSSSPSPLTKYLPKPTTPTSPILNPLLLPKTPSPPLPSPTSTHSSPSHYTTAPQTPRQATPPSITPLLSPSPTPKLTLPSEKPSMLRGGAVEFKPRSASIKGFSGVQDKGWWGAGDEMKTPSDDQRGGGCGDIVVVRAVEWMRKECTACKVHGRLGDLY